MLDCAAFDRALMCQNTGASPVRRLLGIGEWITAFDQCHGELVREMGVATSVAGALGETQVRIVIRVVNALGGVALERLWQAVGEVGAGDLGRDFWLWLFRRV